jgi:predicted ATP-grasp superfamily ATP-dependent carboligase
MGTGGRAAGRIYFQEKVEGRPVSALFAGTGTSTRVLGFSEQWEAPTPGARWRYGGAARPAELSRDLEARLTESVERVAQCFALRGLGSADFLVNGDEARLLEVNPRPGATLDIFDSEADPLLRIHLEAVLDNRLPTALRNLQAAATSAIVYATEPITVPKPMVWQDWTADRPVGGERIDKNRPICTVLARAETGQEAKQLVMNRISAILAECAGEEGGTEWTR